MQKNPTLQILILVSIFIFYNIKKVIAIMLVHLLYNKVLIGNNYNKTRFRRFE